MNVTPQTRQGQDKRMRVLHLSVKKDVPAFPKVKANRKGWVEYGQGNRFPIEITAFNSRSPVNTAIIESKVTYICGKGVRDSSRNRGAYVSRPNPTDSWDDLIEPLATDFETSDCMYLQVILNEDTKTVSLYHQDWTTVRLGRLDDRGRPESFYISEDWTKTSGDNEPVEIEAFTGFSNMDAGVPYLAWHWQYKAGLRFYSAPTYFAALEYVKADGTLGEFYNNCIDNGFTPSVVVSMPTNPPEPEKEVFEADMDRAFSGAKGACSVITLWGETDEVKPTITPFNASANADVYNNVEGIIFQKIISAHRLASPTLAGVAGSGNLSGNAAEIIDSYVLFNYTVIERRRKKLLDFLNQFVVHNGLQQLTIEELDVLPAIRATEAEGEGAMEKTAPATLSKRTSRRSLWRKLLDLWK